MINKIKDFFNKNKNKSDDFDTEDDFDSENEFNEDDDFEDNDFEDNDDNLNEDSEDQNDSEDNDFENDDFENDDFENDDTDDDFDNNNSKKTSPLEKFKNNKNLKILVGISFISIFGYILSPFILNSVENEEDLEDYSYVEPKKKNIENKKIRPISNKRIVKDKRNQNQKKSELKSKSNNKNIKSKLVKEYKDFKKNNAKIEKKEATYNFKDKDPKNEIIKNNKGLLKKVEESNIVPSKKDIIDPFAQEFETTLKMRQMKNALKESKKLMKEYTDFKLLQLAFEKTKNEYNNNKMKNKYQEELNLVKLEFANKLKEMNMALSNIQTQNNNLNSKIKNNENSIKNVSENSIIENKNNIKEIETKEENLFNKQIRSQQVYKIGSTYLLEETDEFGRVKIYRKGNIYNKMKIVDISPDYLKIKKANGTIKILTINTSSSNAVGMYYHTTIKTSIKSSVENKKLQNKNNNIKEVETYGNAVQNRNEEDNPKNSLKSFNSRF